MLKSHQMALIIYLASSFISCQAQTKMGGEAPTASEKKPVQKKAVTEPKCLSIVNPNDLSVRPEIVNLWYLGFNSDEDFKAGRRHWWGWTGIIIGPNAILTTDERWAADTNPGPIRIQPANDSDSSSEHLATLPVIESIITHPSLVPGLQPKVPVTTDIPATPNGTTTDTANTAELDSYLHRVVVLKSALANLPQYFKVSEKRRPFGQQVTLIGLGSRTDTDSAASRNPGSATGTNYLLDTAGLPQAYSWLKGDQIYLIGGRLVTGNALPTADSMPGAGDGGSAMVQANTLIGLNILVDRNDMRGLLGKETIGVYLDLSTKFVQELIGAAKAKNAEVVKENDPPPTPECK